MRIDEVKIISEYYRDMPGRHVMMDVGAHYGSTSLPFLKAGWAVHAFEPDEMNRKELFKLSGSYPLLYIDPRAVSDVNTQNMPFFRSELSSGISTLRAFHESHKPAGRVDTVTLRDYCVAKNITGIDLLKIDTEGYDFKVLKGFPWERILPACVVCEFEDVKTREMGFTLTDLAAFLVSKGYTLIVSEWYPVKAYGAIHEWLEFSAWPCKLTHENGWGNIMAFRDPPDMFRLLNAVPMAVIPPPSVVRETRLADVIQVLIRQKWMLMKKQGVKDVILFGAGKHTAWLLKILRDTEGPIIRGIVDDASASDRTVEGIKVFSPSDMNAWSPVDAIVLSTDTIAETLRTRVGELFGARWPVIDLYEGCPPGPYPKMNV